MRLKKLEMQGFKSFAEKLTMVFEQGITGIVGPNGSGKSNVSDAVRWVLGEQSAKSLRGGRMEDIIFGGTERRRAVALCEVSLTFDNEDGSLPVDFSEVTVTRRVYRSGESEYAINKSPCRLKDVVDLFRDTGIGKEGYSLIGQGRIDEILSVKSEDRRSVFEEAAGITKYKARKEEAERRMAAAGENLSRVADICGEMERQLGPLQQQSEQARRYLALRDEIRSLELSAFVVSTDALKAKFADAQAQYALQEAALLDQAQAETALRENLEDNQADLDAIEAEAVTLRGRVVEATRALEAREGENNVLRERLAYARRDAQRLEAERDRALEAAALAKESGTAAQAEHAQREARLREERARLAADEAEVQRASAHAQEREAALEQAKADLIESMNRQSDRGKTQARLAAMRDGLLSRQAAIKAQSARQEQQHALLTQEDARAREQTLSAKAAFEAATDAVTAAQESDRASAKRVEQGFALVEDVRARRVEAASRHKMLSDMAREYEGFQQSVRQVLREAQRLGGAGVRGVVAELIRVPAEVTRAMEMALGAAMQNIVTETEQDAKRMIDFLRAGRHGRATFLPMGAVRARTLGADERRCLSMPGCLGVASELVGYDPAYRGIVESLLGRTVVATDLNAGIEIMRAGRHAFRLVTLEGDVMHSGGSMTGGSVMSRGASLLGREREIASLHESIEALDRESAEAKAALAREQENRAREKARVAEASAQAHQLEIELARAQEKAAQTQADLSAHGAALQSTREEAEQLAETLADIEAQLAHLDRSEESADTAPDLNLRIADLQARWQKARDALEAAREEAGRHRVQEASLARETEAQAREVERLQAEAERQRDAAARCVRELERQEADAERTRVELKNAEELLIGMNQGLTGGRAELDALEARRHAAGDVQKSLRGRMDDLRGQGAEIRERLHRLELSQARMTSELEALSARIWEEYELSYAGAQAHLQPEFDLRTAQPRIEEVRSQIRAMGAVNVAAVEEYRDVKARYDEMQRQSVDLTSAIEHLRGIVVELEQKMEARFREQFALLNQHFHSMFVRLFGGGTAQLVLQSDDVLHCGIDIIAQPPGKKLQLLSLLSGGERALTAIAILFAMLELKPTPFCILDEIEAALDEANIDNFARFLRQYSVTTQFIIITHRKGTMECCDALYGIAMEEKGVSTMVSVQLTDREERRKPA